MANFNNITIGQNLSVNGLNINQSNTAANIPLGSITLAESIFVQTSSYQQVYLSGSNTSNIATITAIGSAATGTGSISLVASGSGFASFLGNISGSQATIITWNAPLNALYAQAYQTGSYVNFTVVTV